MSYLVYKVCVTGRRVWLQHLATCQEQLPAHILCDSYIRGLDNGTCIAGTLVIESNSGQITREMTNDNWEVE